MCLGIAAATLVTSRSRPASLHLPVSQSDRDCRPTKGKSDGVMARSNANGRTEQLVYRSIDRTRTAGGLATFVLAVLQKYIACPAREAPKSDAVSGRRQEMDAGGARSRTRNYCAAKFY